MPGKNRGALFGLAAMVLILITVLVVDWQFMGDTSADEPFDPTAEARPGQLPPATEESATNEESPANGTTSGGGREGAEPLDQALPAGTEASSTSGSTIDAAIDEPVASDAPTTPETTSGAGASPGNEAGPAPTTTDSGAAPVQAEEQPEFIPPPINSIVADTSGEYEYVEQVHAWIESEFGSQQFEIIDFAASPYPDVRNAARFQVATTARLVVPATA